MKGIIFSEAIFKAVIEGRKTQTRRIMKTQPIEVWDGVPIKSASDTIAIYKEIKLRYKVGEVVYLKEPYQYVGGYNAGIKYKYDNDENINLIVGIIWKNKLFMPEKYARYFIEITDVRVERVQDISEEDCLKEGILCKKFIGDNSKYFYETPTISSGFYDTPQQAYAALIDKINGKGTWEANPFVWVYEFKLVK